MKAKEIFEKMGQFAPFSLAEKWDNAGFLIADENAEISKVLICLDVTIKSVEEAKKLGANLIISHHPVIRDGLKSIDSKTVVYQLIANGISVISGHTNVDICSGGINDELCKRLNLKNTCTLIGDDSPGLGRIGELEEEMSSQDFAKYVKENLQLPMVRAVVTDKTIKKVAVLGGSGGSFFAEVLSKKPDAYVTGDVKHDLFVTAKNIGFTLVDAGHFGTEKFFSKIIKENMEKLIPQVEFIIQENQELYQTI